MYKIIRKGNNEPVLVDDAYGLPLFNKWKNNESMPVRLVVNNIGFMGADIKGIEKLAETEAERAPSNQSSEREYWEYRRKMLALPIETRANIMRIPNLVWTAHTKDPMPDEIKTEIKSRQLAYLKENPKCMYANPKIYSDLIPKPKPHHVSESLNPIQNLLASAALRLVSNVIQADLLDSQYA